MILKPFFVAAAITACFAVQAIAEDGCATSTERKTIAEAKASAAAAGYTNVFRMQESSGCFEAKGYYSDGSMYEVYLNPSTLQIVKVKRKS